MQLLVSEGKIRYVGLSEVGPKQIRWGCLGGGIELPTVTEEVCSPGSKWYLFCSGFSTVLGCLVAVYSSKGIVKKRPALKTYTNAG